MARQSCRACSFNFFPVRPSACARPSFFQSVPLGEPALWLSCRRTPGASGLATATPAHVDQPARREDLCAGRGEARGQRRTRELRPAGRGRSLCRPCSRALLVRQVLQLLEVSSRWCRPRPRRRRRARARRPAGPGKSALVLVPHAVGAPGAAAARGELEVVLAAAAPPAPRACVDQLASGNLCAGHGAAALDLVLATAARRRRATGYNCSRQCPVPARRHLRLAGARRPAGGGKALRWL
jgi:hypothetical protein